MPTPGEGVKVGFHTVGDVVDPDARPFRTDKLADALAEYVREWMPGLDAETAAPISCTYTSTPDEAFVLDRVGPDRGRRRLLGSGLQVRARASVRCWPDLALDPDARAAEAFRLR